MNFLRVPNFHLTATLQLTSNKGSPNSTMLPLHGLQAGAIQRSQSLITLFTSTLKLILANRNSRTIFYFLCVNLCKEMVVIICILLLWLHFSIILVQLGHGYFPHSSAPFSCSFYPTKNTVLYFYMQGHTQCITSYVPSNRVT